MTTTYVVQKTPIASIRAKKEDLPKPPTGHFPPESERFEDLKRSLVKLGMLTPVFIDYDNILVTGHYRFWAAKALKWKEVPAITVVDYQEALVYFEKAVPPV